MPSDANAGGSCRDMDEQDEQEQLERRRMLNREAQRRFRSRQYQAQRRNQEQEKAQNEISTWSAAVTIPSNKSFLSPHLSSHGSQYMDPSPVLNSLPTQPAINSIPISSTYFHDVNPGIAPSLLLSPQSQSSLIPIESAWQHDLSPPDILPNPPELSHERQPYWNRSSSTTNISSWDSRPVVAQSWSLGGSPNPLSEDASRSVFSDSYTPTSNQSTDGISTLTSLPGAIPDYTHSVNPDALSTALFLAAKNGHPGVIRALAESGANLNALDEDGNSALHLALLGKHEDVVVTLLKHKIQRHVSNFDGLTPLLLAAKIGFEEGVRILLQNE